MRDDKLAAEGARREAQRESVKARVEGDVSAGVAARADRTPASTGCCG